MAATHILCSFEVYVSIGCSYPQELKATHLQHAVPTETTGAAKSTFTAAAVQSSRFNHQSFTFDDCICFLSEDVWTPLTVLATRETLYLLDEDHQWRKTAVELAANESRGPCSGGVAVLETQPISCVSSVQLWPSDPCRMDIKLYDEVSVRGSLAIHTLMIFFDDLIGGLVVCLFCLNDVGKPDRLH